MRKKSTDHKLGAILRQIYKIDVALEADHLSKKQLVLSFLTNFKEYCMQRSALFAKFFQHFYLTGSYFEGLRVKEATEFDINVAFDLPFSELNYVINELHSLPSFVTLQLKSYEDCENIPLFDADKYLLKSNILQWFQSLIDSFINSHKMQYPDVLWIRATNSGPARTIKILHRSVWISIDLVPVFSVNIKYLKKLVDFGDFLKANEEVRTSYIVPKPLKPELSAQIPSHMSERVWRTHFPEAENAIIKRKNKLKRVIQLAKALRDKEDWPIPSYFFKVVAHWLVKKNPDEKFWKKKDIGYLFLLFLGALEKHLADEYLGHIFYPRFNLFHSLHTKLLQNLKLRVGKIIQQLKHQPKSAFIIYKIMYISHSSLSPSLLKY